MPVETRMRIHRVLEVATEVALQREARHARKVRSGLRSIQVVDTEMLKLNNAGKVFQQLRMRNARAFDGQKPSMAKTRGLGNTRGHGRVEICRRKKQLQVH